MKHSTFIVALLGILILPAAALACSCVGSDPPRAFNNAQAVFIGRMISGTENVAQDGAGPNATPLEAGHVRFTVEEVFKGEVAGETTIEVASMTGSSCGPYGLQRGERYVVYAYAGSDGSKTLYTGVCTRTIAVSSPNAKTDLTFLRDLPAPGTGGNLQGRIWADLRGSNTSPLANVKITVTNAEGRVLVVRTNREGEFKLSRLKAGTYTVKPILPVHYVSEHESSEVRIDDRGTALVVFTAYIDGKITGRVVDAQGQAANSGFLHLVDGDRTVYGLSTGFNGEFSAEGVPPGEYLMYLEFQQGGPARTREYYYPGTFQRERAVPIKIGLGATVSGLEFTLPNEFRVRTIDGTVRWADGSPAAKVQVVLACPRSADPNGATVEFIPSSATTDGEGRFHLEGFTGTIYSIEARGTRQEPTGVSPPAKHSKSRKMILTESVRDLKLLMTEEGFAGPCDETP